MNPNQETGNQLHIDIAAALGADAGVSVDVLSIYIPNKDRHGVEIGTQRKWVLEALQLLGNLGSGATALPPVEGLWRDDEGIFLWEHPVIVYSYVNPEKFSGHLAKVREFIHRLGRETNQGEVVFEFGQQLFHVRTFDSA